jgi:hypothetical protein
LSALSEVGRGELDERREMSAFLLTLFDQSGVKRTASANNVVDEVLPARRTESPAASAESDDAKPASDHLVCRECRSRPWAISFWKKRPPSGAVVVKQLPHTARGYEDEFKRGSRIELMIADRRSRERGRGRGVRHAHQRRAAASDTARSESSSWPTG